MSLFSGIGAFEKALTRQGIPYQLINYCEIDKHASKAYSLIHNVSEDLNLGDITKIDEKQLPDFDLMTWGFPCTDLTTVGRQRGIIQGETNSGLYYEGLRILKYKQPKYSIIENVKALTDKKFSNQFNKILKDLDDAGYNTYWKVINSKDYGIPQSRQRIIIINIKKDIDKKFEFPTMVNKSVEWKDILENNVDDKYYIKKEWAYNLIKGIEKDDEFNIVSFTRKKIKKVNICNTLLTKTPLGACGNNNPISGVIQNNKLRTFTPLEYWLLMNFDKNDYELVKNNLPDISDSKLYSLAGNSIVIKVLEKIFMALLI